LVNDFSTCVLAPAENSVEFVVHKIILCRNSKFFEKALEGGMLEGRDKKINLACDATACKSLINYVYFNKLDQSAANDVEDLLSLIEIGFLYDLHGLAEKAAGRLLENNQVNFSNGRRIFEEIRKYSGSNFEHCSLVGNLMDKCQAYCGEMVPS
jgi:hypothetical protein